MIQVDISNIWSALSLPDLLGVEAEISAAHMALTNNPPFPICSNADLLPLLAAADRIRRDSEICVVVGSGTAALGARAAIELLQGPERNLGKGREDPPLLFVSHAPDTREFARIRTVLEGKDFSVIHCTVSGQEPPPALQSLRWLMDRKYGTDEANRRTHIAAAPAGTPDAFTLLTPAGLLPMAAAGLQIAPMLESAREAADQFDLRSFENPVWLYTALRCLMAQRGRTAELLTFWEPGAQALGAFWQQIFCRCDVTGPVCVPMELPQSLESVDAALRCGCSRYFETLLRFDSHLPDGTDPESLRFLSDGQLEQDAAARCTAALEDHADRGLPVLSVDCSAPDEAAFGALAAFLLVSCAMSCGSEPPQD